MNRVDVRFQPTQLLDTVSTGSAGGVTHTPPGSIDKRAGMSSMAFFKRDVVGLSAIQVPTDDRPLHSLSQPIVQQETHTRVNDVFKAAAKQLGTLRQMLPKTNDTKAFEARLGALEASMSWFFNEQHTATVDTRQVKFSIATSQPHNAEFPRHHHPSPIHGSARPHNSYQPGRLSEYDIGNAHPGTSHTPAVNVRPLFTRDLLDDHTYRTDNASRYQSYTARTQERSVLIPYDNLRMERASLPEFSARPNTIRLITSYEHAWTKFRLQ